MKQILVDYKSEESLHEISQEYNKNNYKSLIIHVYSGIADYKIITDVATVLHNFYPTASIAGVISAGEIKDGKLIDKGVLISAIFLYDSYVELLKIDNINGFGYETSEKIINKVNTLEHCKCIELLFPGSTMATENMLNKLNELPDDIKVFGGYVGGHDLDMLEHYIFDENGVYDNSLFAIFEGIHIQYSLI